MSAAALLESASEKGAGVAADMPALVLPVQARVKVEMVSEKGAAPHMPALEGAKPGEDGTAAREPCSAALKKGAAPHMPALEGAKPGGDAAAACASCSAAWKMMQTELDGEEGDMPVHVKLAVKTAAAAAKEIAKCVSELVRASKPLAVKAKMKRKAS